MGVASHGGSKPVRWVNRDSNSPWKSPVGTSHVVPQRKLCSGLVREASMVHWGKTPVSQQTQQTQLHKPNLNVEDRGTKNSCHGHKGSPCTECDGFMAIQDIISLRGCNYQWHYCFQPPTRLGNCWTFGESVPQIAISTLAEQQINNWERKHLRFVHVCPLSLQSPYRFTIFQRWSAGTITVVLLPEGHSGNSETAVLLWGHVSETRHIRSFVYSQNYNRIR